MMPAAAAAAAVCVDVFGAHGLCGEISLRNLEAPAVGGGIAQTHGHDLSGSTRRLRNSLRKPCTVQVSTNYIVALPISVRKPFISACQLTI